MLEQSDLCPGLLSRNVKTKVIFFTNNLEIFQRKKTFKYPLDLSRLAVGLSEGAVTPRGGGWGDPGWLQ